jgi:L-2,4-diaminobutyrate decarboxylase
MTFEADAEIVTRALSSFYERSVSGEDWVIRLRPMDDVMSDMGLATLLEEGGLSGEKLAHFVDAYLAGITRIYHPANIAHQQAVPHYVAALAGLVDNFVSSDGSIYEFGPASISIEYFLINWLLEKVGWKPAPLDPRQGTERDHGGGILVNGGSIANLTVLIAARTQIAPEAWHKGNPGNLVVLAPTGAHYSVARAAGIMGMGHQALYPLDVDHRGLIRPDRLPAAYERVRSEGKRVVALVATSGTTTVGLYDPLHEIGAFCQEQGLWLHVDGAHGAPVLLTDKYRSLMRGVELANSLTMNMHKLMRVPAFCTALLARDAGTLDEAFTQDASYLFFDKEQPGYDFHHRTIECTKPVLGLKFFMTLAALGETGMAKYIERQVDLAVEAYDYLQSQPDFSCPVEPQSNILCFRVVGVGDGHLALRDRLLARGNTFVSTTMFNGLRYLRLTLNNPATGMAEIKALVQEIRELVSSD